MPEGQACPRGSAMRPAAGISPEGEHGCPCTPCIPQPARPGRWSIACRRRSAVGGRWWCWLELTPGARPALSFLGALLPPGGRPWGRGGCSAGSWGGGPYGHLAEGPSPGGCTRPGGADDPGSCGRKQNPVGRSGGLNKTDDEGSSLQALLFLSFFFANLCGNPVWRSVLGEFQRPIGLKISALSRRALCQLEWCVSDSVESAFPFRGGRRWCPPLEKLAAWLISHIPLLI